MHNTNRSWTSIIEKAYMKNVNKKISKDGYLFLLVFGIQIHLANDTPVFTHKTPQGSYQAHPLSGYIFQ